MRERDATYPERGELRPTIRPAGAHRRLTLAPAKNNLQPRGLTAGFGGRIALTDGMIHQQDIRRPLGLRRQIPPPRLATVLDFAKTAPTTSARKTHPRAQVRRDRLD